MLDKEEKGMNHVKNLEGYANGRKNEFKKPYRKNERNHLYSVIAQEIKSHKTMLQYDKFFVVRMIMYKIQEGKL